MNKKSLTRNFLGDRNIHKVLFALVMSMKFFLNIAFSFLFLFTYSQQWLWAKGEGDIGNDAANAVTVDDAGNTYITGYIAGKADFSGTIYQGKGIYDMYIAKYDLAGNLLWVKLAGGTGNDLGSSIKWQNGFLYVCGTFENTCYFETTALVTSGELDGFVAKYNDNGNLVWVQPFGGTGYDNATSLTLDDLGNVFVSGNFETTCAFGSVQINSSNLYHESFYAKYNNNGNIQWAKAVTGTNANLITGIAFDHHQSIFLTGYFGGNLTIGNKTVSSTSPSYDIFLAKVESGNGTANWLVRSGSSYEDGSNAVCSDLDGNPTITGYFAGTAVFGNHSVTYADYNDVFIARYDTAGNNVWVRAGKGLQLDFGTSIACDNAGAVFTTGMFQNSIDFDGYSLQAFDRDIFLVSYDTYGNVRWLTTAGGLNTDVGFAIAVNPSTGTVSTAGYYLHTCFFGNIQVDYANANDLWVAAFQPPLINSIETSNSDLQMKAQPNPSNSNFNLHWGNMDEGVDVTVFSLVGETVFTQHFTSDVSVCQLPATTWPSGIYFAEIKSGEKTKTVKLVKQ